MIYKYLFICVLLSSSLITSCAKKEEVSSSVSAPLTSGVWLSNCNYDSTAKGILFDGVTFNDAILHFTNNTCSTVTYVEERIGSYSITTEQHPPIAVAGNFDKSIDDYAITPATSAAAITLNSSSMCGFTNWASGTTKVVTGLNCGSGMLVSGALEYDTYDYSLMDMQPYSSAGDLLFGYFDSSHDGSTADKRPTASNGNYTFRRYDIGNMSLSNSNTSKILQLYLKNK